MVNMPVNMTLNCVLPYFFKKTTEYLRQIIITLCFEVYNVSRIKIYDNGTMDGRINGSLFKLV